MKKLLWIIVIISSMASSAFAQSNKIVFGPLEGDDAGVLTVHNGEDIEIEMWVRTDPANPARIVGFTTGLMSEDEIIAERNCAVFDPDFYQLWDTISCDGPFGHDPDDYFPIPEGYTCDWISALCWSVDCTGLDTNGEWDYAASFMMTCNTDVPTDETYYPFTDGWWPHSGQGTAWSFDVPPGGSVIPELDHCGLYFEPDTCIYIPGDVNRNGAPLELADVLAMVSSYRGLVEPYYLCQCSEDPPIFDFAATADPNGNCIPNELNDVVTEIGAYRGSDTVSGCPDCPGSGPLLIGQNKDR